MAEELDTKVLEAFRAGAEWAFNSTGINEGLTVDDKTIIAELGGKALGLRPEVLKFAQLMEKNLRKHDPDRGQQGWQGDSPEALYDRLGEECNELWRALPVRWRKADGDPAKKCADVANFAMMIADVVGGLK